MIIGGTTEKVLQFLMPLKAVYNGFIEQKCVFEHCGKVKTRKICWVKLFLSWNICSANLFKSCPYKHLLALNKDALFHFEKFTFKMSDHQTKSMTSLHFPELKFCDHWPWNLGPLGSELQLLEILLLCQQICQCFGHKPFVWQVIWLTWTLKRDLPTVQ